jgi:signal transduction histidine kinase
VEAPSGTVWVGTGPGELWRFENGRFTGFLPPATWPFSRCATLCADQPGVIWMGTLGGGLVRFENGQFTRVTSGQGLPHDHITQLLDDGMGNLWAGTMGGIFRSAKAELTDVAAGRANRVHCTAYGLHEGLPALECSARFHPACWRSRDGRLWFATVKGLASVDPREVESHRRAPPAWIEELRVDGGMRDFDRRNAVTIEPGRHYMQFRFTGLDFSAPDKVRFRWKLEGVEQEWQDGDRQRVVGYGPLSPGEYSFRVLAGNNDGVWNEQGDALAFTILPHFWETWWFKTATATSIVGGFALLTVVSLQRRYRRRLDLLERQRGIERERSRIAQDLHDDLGTTLTQIGLLSALLERGGNTPSEAQELTRQIRTRAREMVSALNEIVWAVNPKNDSLNETLGYFGNFAEQFLRSTPVRCRLDFPESMPDQALPSEVRHPLFLAFKEALNNAAKHANASELCITARQADRRVVIQVKDNGRGFDLSRRATSGNGLSNMRGRLEKLGGRCEVSSQPGRGTTIEFHLPEA